MNKDLKKEGFKLFKKIFGNDLSFEELEEILEENQNKELIIFLFKNLINFFGLSIKLGQKIDQNVCLEMPPKKIFKT